MLYKITINFWDGKQGTEKQDLGDRIKGADAGNESENENESSNILGQRRRRIIICPPYSRRSCAPRCDTQDDLQPIVVGFVFFKFVFEQPVFFFQGTDYIKKGR